MTDSARSKLLSRHRGKFRAQAELLLKESARKISKLPVSDMHNLAHELHVHQMELEMQNEELRRIQLELEASRDRFSTLYDFSPVGYLKLNEAGIIHEANLTVASQMGVDRRELIGRKLSHFLAQESQDEFYLYRQRLYRAGARQICELKILKPAGGNFTARLESVVLQTEPNGSRDCLSALSDITEELHSEAERAHLAAIVESSNDAIISSHLDDTIASWNAGAKAMFGYTSEEMVGRPVSFLATIRHLEPREARRSIQDEPWLEPLEALWLTKDGREINVWITTSPIRNAHGKILGISRIVRDVTRQKASEEALRESERNLVDFFNEAPLGLIWVRRDGPVLKMNRAQLEMLDCDQTDVINRPISQFFIHADECGELLRRLAARETIKNFRAQLQSKTHGIKHVLIDANGLWKNRRLVHSRWFVRDITRRMELEREILAISEREQHRIGQDLHDDLGQQLAGVEFAVQSLAGQLSRVSKPASKQAEAVAQMVQSAMDHTRNLARGLSPLSLEADGLMVALRELAATVTKIFRVDCRFHSKPPVTILNQSVGTYLYRIAQEAINNAIKHGRATRIDISITLKGREMLLSIKDNGTGIPKHFRKNHGMGLRVMQYRAGMIGGSLVVRRQAKRGTAIVCSIKNDLTLYATRK